MSQDRILVLGIGGTLMGSLAILAKQSGSEVYGFDKEIYPPMSDQLRAAGIQAQVGFSEQLLKAKPTSVIVGNASQRRGVEAVERVLEEGLNYTSGAAWLGNNVLRNRQVFAVSGTHGKTTTSSILAWLLSNTHDDPGYLIGGVPRNFDSSTHLGTSRPFVLEADEYDTSYFDRRSKFVHYRPDVLTIANLEYDHADIFESIEEIKDQFHLLLRSIPRNGKIVVPADDNHVQSVIDRGCWTPVAEVRVLRRSDPLPKIARSEREQWIARLLRKDGTRFTVYRNAERIGTVSWENLGEHNVSNALFALAAATASGVDPEQLLPHLQTFRGIKRRLELFASAGNVKVYDDFAHHPTAIRKTLQGLRMHFPADHILAVIEPSSHTMKMGTHGSRLLECCLPADEAIWWRTPGMQWDIDELKDNSVVPTSVLHDSDELLQRVCAERNSDTHVVLMSNSHFGGIYERIKEVLEPT